MKITIVVPDTVDRLDIISKRNVKGRTIADIDSFTNDTLKKIVSEIPVGKNLNSMCRAFLKKIKEDN